jgi:hypothetical protein
MAWHLQLGFDERIMQKVDAKQSVRQRYVFSVLSIMLFSIGVLIFVSTLIFMTIVFQNLVLAICVGLFLAIIIFNIYRFLIVSSVNASYSGLAETQSNH